jgi:hypothetical protein
MGWSASGWGWKDKDNGEKISSPARSIEPACRLLGQDDTAGQSCASGTFSAVKRARNGPETSPG